MRTMRELKFGILFIVAAFLVSFAGDADAQRGRLQQNEIRTRHLFAKSVTSGKLAIDTHALSVTNGTNTATSTAVPGDIGGTVIGCSPTGNQDQFIDNVTVNGSGSVVITLAANATATNTFNCFVLRNDAHGVS